VAAPHPTDPSVLSRISLFRAVPTRDLERLAARMHERTFPAGAGVLTAEEPGEADYVLLGRRQGAHYPSGRNRGDLAVMGPGEVVGEMSVPDSLGRSASVTTLEDSTFLWMDRKTFLSGIEEVPAISRNLCLGILSRRLHLADTHTRSLAVLDVHGCIAAQLLAFAREYGEPLARGGGTLIPLRLTQADLGGVVGASGVRVNQALGYFRKMGAISLDKGGA